MSDSENTEVAPQNRVLYLDALRAHAIFWVVVIHVSWMNYFHADPATAAWWISNFYGSFARTCVPLFVMASGALLLENRPNEGTLLFFRKRFFRVFVPFLLWSALYYLWRIYFTREAGLVDSSPTMGSFLQAFVSGPVYSHLWFLNVILGLYLITPILRVWVRGASQSDFKYFLGLWFIFTFWSSVLDPVFGLRLGLSMFVAVNYVGYFVLGFYLHHFRSRESFLIRAQRIAFLVVFTMGATYFLTRSTEKFNEGFYNYLSPNVILMSLFSFQILRDFNWAKLFACFPTLQKQIAAVSSTSFGIYLIHVMWLDLYNAGRLGFRPLREQMSLFFATPLEAIFILSLSLIVVLALKKIPVVKAIVP